MVFHIPEREIFIAGPASFLPADVVTNEEFLRRCGLTTGVQTRAQWIESRTGIRERRWASGSEAVSDLAFGAAKSLLDSYPSTRDGIRNLILSTISGDHLTPPTSPFVQHRLGLTGISSFDVGAACAGFVMGLHIGSQLAPAGGSQLVVAADIRSKFLNLEDLSTAILFGDGAAACVVSSDRSSARFRVLGTCAFVEGSTAELIVVPAGGSRMPFKSGIEEKDLRIQMRDGAQLFVKAIEGMEVQSRALLTKLGLNIADISHLVPHQANLLMIRELVRRLGARDGACIEIVQTTGNTSGASVGLALTELSKTRQLKSGEKVLLTAAGGGGFLASAVLEVV